MIGYVAAWLTGVTCALRRYLRTQLVFGVYAIGCTFGGLAYAWQLDRHLAASAGKSLKVRSRVRLTVLFFALAASFWLAMFIWSTAEDRLSPTAYVLYMWGLLLVEAVVGSGAVRALYTGGRANLLITGGSGGGRVVGGAAPTAAARRRATTGGGGVLPSPPRAAADEAPVIMVNIMARKASEASVPGSAAATSSAVAAAAAAAVGSGGGSMAAPTPDDPGAGVVVELEPRKGSDFLRVVVVHEPEAARVAAAAGDPGRQHRVLSMRSSSERAQVLNPLNSFSQALSARRLQL
jgi:hypothetical protein